MTTLLLTVGIVAGAMALMAVGVLLTGRRLRGSCGGAGATGCACHEGDSCHSVRGQVHNN